MKSFKVRRNVVSLILAVCMVLMTVPVTAFAAEPSPNTQSEQPNIVIQKIADGSTNSNEDISTYSSKTYVDRVGTLAPGQSISGTFKLTNWLGNDFNVMAGAGNSGVGSLSFSFVSARYDLPCDGKARVICREKGWSAGTYSYSIYNGTGKTTQYSLLIYEP